MKVCSRCKVGKSVLSFSSNGAGIKSQCKPCNSTTQKEQRRRNKKTYLKGKWVAMKARVEGRSKGCVTAAGKSLIDKDDFIRWSLASEDFNRLFDGWVSSDFNLQMSPSIDRIKVNKGYTLDNMQFILFSENTTKDRKLEYSFISPEGKVFSGRCVSKFCLENNLTHSCVSQMMTGKKTQHKGWTLA